MTENFFLCLNKRIVGTAESARYRSKMVCKKLEMLFRFILSGSAIILILAAENVCFPSGFFGITVVGQ